MKNIKRVVSICNSIICIFCLTSCGRYTDSEENLISEADFMKCFQTVEITADNWTDYFQLSEEENYYTDSFGDKTGEYEKLLCIVPAEKYYNGYFCLDTEDNIILRISYEELDKYSSIDENGGNLGNHTAFPDDEEFRTEERDIEISDYTFADGSIEGEILITYHYVPITNDDCYEADGKKVVAEVMETEYQNLNFTKAKGTVIVGVIPEEYWTKAHEGSNAELGTEQDYIAVKGEDGIIKYYYADGSTTSDSEGNISELSIGDSFYHSGWQLQDID